VYRAFKASVQLAKKTGSLAPPKHILNASTYLMKDIGHGAGYQYDHDSDDGFSGQNYFPDGVRQQSLYRPDGKGFENEIVKRLDHWREIRKEKGS
jgi:putative ATPase